MVAIEYRKIQIYILSISARGLFALSHFIHFGSYIILTHRMFFDEFYHIELIC